MTMQKDSSLDIPSLAARCAATPTKPMLSGAVRDFVEMAAAGNTDADDLQRLACDLLGREHPKKDDDPPIQTLTCCCCGESCQGRQWHNRDTGYGLCASCADGIAGRDTDKVEMKMLYGVRGFHYAVGESYTINLLAPALRATEK
jgi:hypothetical protein